MDTSNRSTLTFRPCRPSCCAGKFMVEKKRRSAPPQIAAEETLDGVSEPTDGRLRAVIDAVEPAVDGGRFPAKCITGEPVRIAAHCFADGHDRLRVVLRWQAGGEGEAFETDMTAQ